VNQATLDGIEPPPPAPSTPELAAGVKVCFMGTPVAPLQVHHNTEGRVRLVAVLRQDVQHHPRAVPVLVKYTVPELGSFAATYDYATKRAAELSAEREIIVVGQGLELGHHEGREVLRLLHCRAIARPPSHVDITTPEGSTDHAHS
jgi:hypothetical protein